MEMADAISRRSKCDKAQIGCVIVAPDQTVVSCSYNGPPPKYYAPGTCSSWCPRMQKSDKGSNYDSCPSSHAEANGISRADHSRTIGATAYVTGACCMTCAKLIASAGIVRVVHRVGKNDLHRHPEAVEDFLRQAMIKVERI